MELKQFIKEALLGITNGVDDANKEANRFKILGVKHESGIDGNYADFDVSVVVNEESKIDVNSEVKASWLSVVSAKLGSKIAQSNLNKNSHRLTFKVYISEK